MCNCCKDTSILCSVRKCVLLQMNVSVINIYYRKEMQKLWHMLIYVNDDTHMSTSWWQHEFVLIVTWHWLHVLGAKICSKWMLLVHLYLEIKSANWKACTYFSVGNIKMRKEENLNSCDGWWQHDGLPRCTPHPSLSRRLFYMTVVGEVVHNIGSLKT